MPIRTFGDHDLELVKQVLDSGKLSGLDGGKFTAQFEAAFAAAHGAKHGVAMNAAMSVLHASVITSGAGAGDEVICDPICVFGGHYGHQLTFICNIQWVHPEHLAGCFDRRPQGDTSFFESDPQLG